MRYQDKQRATSLRLPPTPPYSPPLHLAGANIALQPACSLASLPTETLQHVLSYLSPATLAAVARVSRAVLPLARAALYRRLAFRNQRDGANADDDESTGALDGPSSALLATLEAHPETLAAAAHAVDFDLVAHLGADAVAALLARVLSVCTALGALRLGAGSHGHGIGFRGLYRSLALAPAAREAAARLRTLDVAACAGAPHTLAMLLLEMPALVELHVGQFLLEKEDRTVFCGGRSAPCALETLVARGRLTETAFDFCTAGSRATLQRAVLPLCDKAALDLTPFTALSHVELSVFLASAPTPFSPAHAAFQPTMARLQRNFASTLGSARDLARVTLSGTWDSATTAPPGASHAVDLVLHAELLEALPRAGVTELVVRTELNALALARWLADDAWWSVRVARAQGDDGEDDEAGIGRPSSAAGSTTSSAPSLSISTCVPSPLDSPSPPPSAPPAFVPPHSWPPALRRLELWQKTSYSSARRDFQARVRERVSEGARLRGVEVVWRCYERW